MQLLAVITIVLVSLRFLVVFGQEEEVLTDERMFGNTIEDNEFGKIKYDEYPVIVPKRAALLLDRLMVALQKALEDEDTPAMAALPGKSVSPRNIQPPLLPLPRISPGDELNFRRIETNNVDLQRRGHNSNNNDSRPKGRVWRCYFNAVTCFKKKRDVY